MTSPLTLSLTLASLLLVAVAVLHILIPHFLRNWMAKKPLNAAQQSQAVYLTFDDGPDPEGTPQLLDTLAAHGAKATFFLVGSRCLAHPELVRRIQAEGHAIGSHSQTHRHAWKTTPFASYRDTLEGIATLKKLGIESRLWRPPYGKASLPTLFHALRHKLDLIYWTRDSKDYEPDKTAEGLAGWLQRETRPGSVILLHDGRMNATPEANITPAGIHRYFESGTRANIAFKTLPELRSGSVIGHQ